MSIGNRVLESIGPKYSAGKEGRNEEGEGAPSLQA